VRKLLAVTLMAGGLAALLAGPATAQCVMCKTALSGSPEGRRMIAQFNYAILLMVVAPYLVMGGFVVGVYRERIAHRLARFGATVRARLEALPARWATVASRAHR